MERKRSLLIWPEQCCVAAFLARAATTLLDCQEVLQDEDQRREIAKILGVSVGFHHSNPWGLPVSDDERNWGVRPNRAADGLELLQRHLGYSEQLSLELKPVNEIDFEFYEDEVLRLSAEGCVVGIGIDYTKLSELEGLPPPEDCSVRNAHVLRLTPLNREEVDPTILSPGFDFDYPGRIYCFDDTGELPQGDSLVNWRSVVISCRANDGHLWGVRRRPQRAAC